MAKKKVILIDDSETSLLLFSSLFDEKSGIIVQTESNSKMALQRISAAKPDLIILDLMMPEIDGFQILKKIKIDPVLKVIPVIILSAIHDNITINKAKQLGAVDFIRKPFNVDEISKTILYHLNKLKNNS